MVHPGTQVYYLLDVVPTGLVCIQADVLDRIFKVAENLQNAYIWPVNSGTQ